VIYNTDLSAWEVKDKLLVLVVGFFCPAFWDWEVFWVTFEHTTLSAFD
jgi:hypothetical protein